MSFSPPLSLSLSLSLFSLSLSLLILTAFSVLNHMQFDHFILYIHFTHLASLPYVQDACMQALVQIYVHPSSLAMCNQLRILMIV